MSIFGLKRAFDPQSIAIIGASPDHALGGIVYANVRAGGFQGRIEIVNPRHVAIEGKPCLPSLDHLDGAVDLVVVMTPAATVPDIIESAGRKGCGVAVVLSAGLGHGTGSISERMRIVARANGIRVIGPNCLGILAPHAHLNASFASVLPQAGSLAVISQSGAIAAAMAEWGVSHSIGFSAIASLGDQSDADLGDMLDYFALDRQTRAILLYVEAVMDARKFISAARSAARAKPVIVLKSGRHQQGARAAATHTGALAGSDSVYDAAFRRAGMLRVKDMAELFAAAETLARFRTIQGNRLAILTNGGGLGVLAADSLADQGYSPALLSSETLSQLNAAMPSTWSKADPVDIVGDADAPRYEKALRALIDDPQNDAILVLNVQTAMASSIDTAHAVTETLIRERSRRVEPKPVLTCWMGSDASVEAIFHNAQVPHYETEIEAVRGFSHLVHRAELTKSLLVTPAAAPDDLVTDESQVREIVSGARRQGRSWLDPWETSAVLTAYGIQTPPVIRADGPDAAATGAAAFLKAGQPVAVKILSQDIQHKSDVDGVRLNLTTEESVRDAVRTVMKNAKDARPSARIQGVVVQPMITRPRARELIAGIARDPTFGSVIAFGQGGIAVEIVNDRAIALPPLDQKRADELISRTRISRLLESYRNVPAARREDVALVLVRLSQLAADVPEILEIDINPLLADEHGVIALDARVAIDTSAARASARYSHFAIRPYPKEWERTLTLNTGQRVFVRPVRPEDESLYEEFFRHVSDDDLRLRFFGPVKNISHAFIARLTQIDYGRAIALLALDKKSGEIMGVVRLHTSPDLPVGEYAILLRSDLKGRGLGWALMELIIEYARKEGLLRIHGRVLRENIIMLQMCREFGFEVREDPEEVGVNIVSLNLIDAGEPSQTGAML